MKLTPGDIIRGFHVESCKEVPYFDSDIYKLTHKTGAVLYYSTRDDGQMLFGAGFRTTPEDDTGVFHILEHSCLDGSDLYPLREPFVNLMKTSMSTNLNAYTANDRTVYHFGSINLKDYMNMMTVYVDAIFHPLFLRDRRIFEKEAWRFEPDGNNGLRLNGVVLNEMQAYENTADQAEWMGIMNTLFVNTPYSHESGGTPFCIRKLSYEKFCETYRKYYRADNCTFFMSGKLDLENKLEYLDSVLNSLPVISTDKPGIPQSPAPVINYNADTSYNLPANEASEKNTILTYAMLLNPDVSYLPLAVMFLSRYLAEGLDSVLTKAVLDAGIGQDFNMNINAFTRSPILTFSIKKSEPELAGKFRQVIEDTLRAEAEKGFDRDRINNLTATHESMCRRDSLNVGSGMKIMGAVMSAVASRGEYKPVNDLALIREQMERDDHFFENLVLNDILGSNSRVLLRTVPSRSLAEEKCAVTNAYLAESRKAMTDDEYSQLVSYSKEFNKYLDTPDSAENVAKLPRLELYDLNTEHDMTTAEEEKLRICGHDVKYLKYIAKTNGFISATVNFDLSRIPFEDVKYTGYLNQLLPVLGTLNHTNSELRDMRNNLSLSMDFGFSVYTSVKTGVCSPYLTCSLNGPAANLPEALSLVSDNIHNLRFDKEAVFRTVSAACANGRQNMIGNGISTAMIAADSGVTASGAYSDALSGVGSFRKLEEILKSFDSSYQDFADTLSRVYSKVFASDNAVITFAGEEESEKLFCRNIDRLGLEFSDRKIHEPVLCRNINRGYIIPGDIGYCVSLGNALNVGYEYCPAINLITSWLNGAYLWDELRAKGGAYGGGIFLRRESVLVIYSYRDPHVVRTYNTFDRMADWIDNNIPSKDELTSLIIKTAAGYDMPRSEFDRASIAFHSWFIGTDRTKIGEQLETLKNTDESDFRKFSDMLRRMKPYMTYAAAAPAVKLKDSGLFGIIEEI